MVTREPDAEAGWKPLTVHGVAELLGTGRTRWWISGGVALDHWLGTPIRKRPNIDVSTTASELVQLVGDLPTGFSAWATVGDDLLPWHEIPDGVDLHALRIHDDTARSWVLKVNVEDGTEKAWLYRRDPRLQLSWDRAVLDIDGIPTGAPEVQLVWKALRPRPEDETDRDAVLPKLADEARAWFERAILSIHPHSTWSIHIRSPFAPAKASWDH